MGRLQTTSNLDGVRVLPPSVADEGMERLQLNPNKPDYLVSRDDHDSRKSWDPMGKLSDARGKEHAGYYCFLYDVTADENEMNNLIASQQKGSVYDLEAVVERLAEKLCDAYGNRMVSLKYREQDWAEYSIAFEKNDNYVVSQSGWLGGKPEGW